MDLCALFKPLLVYLNRCKKKTYLNMNVKMPEVNMNTMQQAASNARQAASQMIPEDVKESPFAQKTVQILSLTAVCLVAWFFCSVAEKLCKCLVQYFLPPQEIKREPVKVIYSDEEKRKPRPKKRRTVNRQASTPGDSPSTRSPERKSSMPGPVDTVYNQKLHIKIPFSNGVKRSKGEAASPGHSPGPSPHSKSPASSATNAPGAVDTVAESNNPMSAKGTPGSKAENSATKAADEFRPLGKKVDVIHKFPDTSSEMMLQQLDPAGSTRSGTNSVSSLGLGLNSQDPNSISALQPGKNCSKCDMMTFHPYTFRWTRGGKRVFVSGTFLNWCAEWPMQPNAQTGAHELSVTLPRGHHEFKFHVDGEWRLDLNMPAVTNNNGATNHVIHLRD